MVTPLQADQGEEDSWNKVIAHLISCVLSGPPYHILQFLHDASVFPDVIFLQQAYCSVRITVNLKDRTLKLLWNKCKMTEI